MPSLLHSLAAAILTYGVHSAVACAIALAIARFIRRPQDRDLLWKAALVAPIVTATTIMLVGALGDRGFRVDLAQLVRRGIGLPLPGRKLLVHVVQNDGQQNVVKQFTDPVATTLSAAAVAIAMMVVLVAFARFAARRRELGRALAPREPLGEFAVDGGAPILVSAAEDLQSPVAFGTGGICLPRGVVAEFSLAHTQSLIAHETAHLERRDPAWFLAAELISALSAFQPLIFVVANAFRRDVELICDEAAVGRTGDRGALIGALARLAAPFDARSPLYAAMAYDGSPLVARAERIAALPAAPPQRGGRRRAVFAVAVLVALLFAIPVFSSVPRLADFPDDLQAIARDARASGHRVRIDSTSIGNARIVRRTIVRVD